MRVYSDDEKKAIDLAGDYVKVTTGLAAGALVFSIGLVPNMAGYTACGRMLIIIAWILLFLSMITGGLAQGAIPMQIARGVYDVEDPVFANTVKAHNLTFLVATLLLGAALVIVSTSEAPVEAFAIRTPTQAVEKAGEALPEGVKDHIARVSVIELIKGAGQEKASLSSWHAQFEIRGGNVVSAKPVPNYYVDVMVDPEDGKTAVIERPASESHRR